MLPNLKLGLPPYQINIEVAYSTIAADLDNCIKPMIDILQKNYVTIHPLCKDLVVDLHENEKKDWTFSNLKSAPGFFHRLAA
jgi:hypothetical protein